MILLANGCSTTKLSVYPTNWKTCGKEALELKWYIYYRFYDPSRLQEDGSINPKLVVIKGMNDFKTLGARKAKTKELLKETLKDLQNGYNPVYPAGKNSAEKPLSPILSTEFVAKPIPTLISTKSQIIPQTLSLPVEQFINSGTGTSIPQDDIYSAEGKLPEKYQIYAHSPLMPALYKVLDIGGFDPEMLICLRSVLKYSTMAAVKLGIDQVPINKVTPLFITVLLECCKEIKGALTDRTYNFYRAHLMILFKKLRSWKIIELDPVEAVASKDHIPGTRLVLTIEERKLIDRFLRINNYRFWRLVVLFFHSGIRRTEIMRLKARDINLQKLTYQVLVKKGKYRNVTRPIKAICKWLWEEVLAECEPDQYIFGKRLQPSYDSINPRQITRRWRLWVKKKLGIKADFYSLKHLNSDEVAARLDLEHTAALNSHGTEVAKIYAVNEEKRKLLRIQKLGNAFVPPEESNLNETDDFVKTKKHVDMTTFKKSIYNVGVFTKNKTDRNPHTLLLIPFVIEGLGIWRRVFKNRGINKECLLFRPATEEENQKLNEAWRLKYYAFNSWQELIQSEWDCTEDREWCDKLLKQSGIELELDSVINT